MLPLLLQLAPPVFEPAPTPDQQEVIAAELDALRRLTVPVVVNDRATARFLIDTGAERTVVSDLIAAGLPGPREAATIIHMAGVSPVEVVTLDTLALGSSEYRRIEAPILRRRQMGVDGVLGTDALQEQRILFDFDAGQVTVISPGERAPSVDGIVIQARRRSGRLILTTATIDGVAVDVVIDTGAQRTVGNPALADRLARRRGGEVGLLTSITGDTIAARTVAVRRLAIGPLAFDGFAIAVVDSPAFASLDLIDRPAILLGMDAIGQFGRVLVNFPDRSVRFVLTRRPSARRPPTRTRKAPPLMRRGFRR